MLSIYIKKLSHPLKEIRERSLQLLLAKLRLGWELDDELSGTRQLLEALLAWFLVQEPSLQCEALELLLTTIKTQAGTYIAKEFGITSIIANLNKVRHKINPEAQCFYEDVMETLRFINTVESHDHLSIPRLQLPDVMSSESEGSTSGYYNLGPNFQSSKETSISNDDLDINKYGNSSTSEAIRLLLFPWVDLCKSDRKTLLLVEDALRLLKSTRRCCRFICDVFLRDFPPEIFLNRPEIIKCLLTISEGNHGGRPAEALLVLLCITRALRKRILQLSALELVHDANKILEDHRDIDEGVNIELAELAGGRRGTPQEDENLAVLKQVPAPVFALETMHAVLSTMARSVVLVDPTDTAEFLDAKELNISICLVENLIDLLLACVTESFWTVDHCTKTYRDISHKSCMVMRLLGDLLAKYRKSFSDDPDRSHHRVAWLRLVMCAERLLHWARDSALPPSQMIAAIQIAQLDPAVELFYPELSRRIEIVLQNTKSTVDQEYKSKYRELKKIFISMDDAVLFMKNKTIRSSKKILTHIKNSLPVLELFQSESFLFEIADILLKHAKDLELDERDWSLARSIALSLMAHNVEWVKATFYKRLADMVKSVLVGDDFPQGQNEKCLTLLYDVGIMTEICCQGLCSKSKEVLESSSDIMLYLLRGRMVLSESGWWRLLASLLPVLPLLHVYAEHDTQLGKAICKSLDRDIAECMGVSLAEVTAGLVRLLFVKCVAVQLDVAHTLCQLINDERYLPPKEALRADVLLNALRRVQSQDFNIDTSSSPSKSTQSAGLLQILDVLKQDIMLDEHGSEFVTRSSVHPTLEPSLRRSTLQQLAVMLRQQELHDAFFQYDGIKVIVATLRMSLMVDDYLAFPECAISCVSILNSVCFASRHTLSKIPDLPSLLVRVILVFPANDATVTMAGQVLALIAWAGFALQELDSSRQRVPALPLSVTQRTNLPFKANSYWHSSPNAEHSYIEWLLAEEDWRAAIRVRWWCAHSGRSRILTDAPPSAPLSLRPTPHDIAALKAACPIFSSTKALLALENATSHRQVTDALNTLESYTYIVPPSCASRREFASLPWHHTRRFLCAPASSRDAALLCCLLHFIEVYMENIPRYDGTMAWIKSAFIGNDPNIITLLSRDQVFPQQTANDSIEVTQLHILIVKVLLRCIITLEHEDNYSSQKLESLIKILLTCLERIDLKNFHMLGYLNELLRCIRYALNSRYCRLSEETAIECLRVVATTLSGCASGGGRKGQACRLDAVLAILALLKQIHDEAIPVQRWSEGLSTEAVHAIVKCTRGARVELRAAALQAAAALACYAQLMPHLVQATQEQSLAQYAARIFSQRGEANAVRAAAARLLAVIAARASSRSDVLESDMLEQLQEFHFLEKSLDLLVDFCNAREYKQTFEPNVSLSLLERRSELEVRAEKVGGVVLSAQTSQRGNAPPTAALVASVADVIHNFCVFPRCPVQEWNERGVYRLLFRCASWSGGSSSDVRRVRASSCRALVAAAGTKCVRAALAATKDCLHNFMLTLTPIQEDDLDRECLTACAQAVTLLATLLGERAAAASVWRQLKDGQAASFLHLLLQCLDSDEIELQDAALYCLTQLAQSTNRKHPDKTKAETCIALFDSTKSPYWGQVHGATYGAGDSARSDCQPEYVAEEIGKVVITLYQKLWENRRHLSSEDDRWVSVCACLSSLLSVSPRARLYAVHRQLPRLLLATLQTVRDHLSLLGKPVDVIRNSNNNPVLRTLSWLLTIIDCSMVECQPAKESFAEDELALSLCRLWLWCMMTDQLRQAVMHLLYTFTNECPKAWSSMCMCVSGRSLVGEVCALAGREAGLQSRPRPDALLLLCVHTLRRQLEHHHCRAIILKSDILTCMYKLCARERVRGPSTASVAWTRLCEVLARHADGAAAMLALLGTCPLSALPAATRARMLPALAHAARLQRPACLHSPELLELLSGTLLAGDTAETVSAARAVWALAANNHKAKLMLRSAGVSAAVHSALQRLQRSPLDAASQRALQLLTYTNTVLQAT